MPLVLASAELRPLAIRSTFGRRNELDLPIPGWVHLERIANFDPRQERQDAISRGTGTCHTNARHSRNSTRCFIRLACFSSVGDTSRVFPSLVLIRLKIISAKLSKLVRGPVQPPSHQPFPATSEDPFHRTLRSNRKPSPPPPSNGIVPREASFTPCRVCPHPTK